MASARAVQRAGDRVIIRETIRDAGLHNGSAATVGRVQGSVLFVERRDGHTVPIDTCQFPGVQHGYGHTEYRQQGSTRYAESSRSTFRSEASSSE